MSLAAELDVYPYPFFGTAAQCMAGADTEICMFLLHSTACQKRGVVHILLAEKNSCVNMAEPVLRTLVGFAHSIRISLADT